MRSVPQVVEIDRGVITVAQRFFGVFESPRPDFKVTSAYSP